MLSSRAFDFTGIEQTLVPFCRKNAGWPRERTLQNQLQRASALNLIINAISIWNTLYLEKAIDYKKAIGEDINEDLITHISPLVWEHINMLGEYSFNFDNAESTELIRPLNI